MELSNEFSVPVPVDRAWATLLDVERVAPCMPGATLTSFDGETFAGTVKVKLGPVNLTYAGKGRFASRDFVQRRVVIEASGKDSRGTGTASATVTASLSPDGDGTRVHVITDLHITGAAAQFGRGMIDQVAGRLITQFADCLASALAAGATPVVSPNGAKKPQPIDLLQVSGAKRLAPYALIALALVIIGVLALWLIR
jgi:carbon monoxide dehydrogenase subunit G